MLLTISLILAATLMVGIWSRSRGGLRVFAMAIALALASIPSGAWAKAPDPASAEIDKTRPPATTPIEPAPGPGTDYASREANAKDLEKFEGGDTVVIAGSTLAIVLLVVLLVVLL